MNEKTRTIWKHALQYYHSDCMVFFFSTNRYSINFGIETQKACCILIGICRLGKNHDFKNRFGKFWCSPIYDVMQSFPIDTQPFQFMIQSMWNDIATLNELQIKMNIALIIAAPSMNYYYSISFLRFTSAIFKYLLNEWKPNKSFRRNVISINVYSDT